MKILHALVGYLAVTALPFHPFASASPLAAIDYDGYVTTQNHTDSALMNHVLGSIEEACQAVNTQIHGDSALIKRVSGDIIEARQEVEIAPAVFVVIAVIASIVLSIVWVEGDDPVRGNYVSSLVVHFDHNSSARNVRGLPKILSARPFRNIQNLTGLFATLHIPSILMELRARTGVTPITN